MVKWLCIFICGFTFLSSAAFSEDALHSDSTLDNEVTGLPISVFRKLGVSGGECYAKMMKSSGIQKTPAHSTEMQGEEKLWKQVICETQVTPEFIIWVQERLAANNQFLEVPHKRGSEAVLDKAMYEAIEAFQISKNLARGGLTYETIHVLNQTKMR